MVDRPENSSPTRVGVIDIGTNSTRLLAAEVTGEEVRELVRRTQVTRLGRGVDLSGQLSVEATEDVFAVIAGYVEELADLGIASIDALATSAVRDASNGAAFIAELRERFALKGRVLPGDEEARLTYAGATAGMPPAEPTVVIDVGGGSTELVVGKGDEVLFRASLQVGVVRHSERHIVTDPPTASELEDLAHDVQMLLNAAMAEEPAAHASAGIAVAGTPTSLAAIQLALDPYDSELVHGHRLSLSSIQHMLSQLASVSLVERAAVTGLHPDRAPTIVAGVVILMETMRCFGLDEVVASEHDILHGAAIDLAARV